MDEQPKIPLSKRKRGYLIAVAAGTVAGPIGWVVSPLVLLVINKLSEKNKDKNTNIFAIWTLIGMVLTPAIWTVYPKTDSTSISTSSSSESVSTVNIPKGWYKSDRDGIFWKWCTQDCDSSKVIGDSRYSLMQVWCRDEKCGDIYARVNLEDKNGVVIGWTNDTGYGDKGQKVLLTFQSYQNYEKAALTEMNFR